MCSFSTSTRLNVLKKELAYVWGIGDACEGKRETVRWFLRRELCIFTSHMCTKTEFIIYWDLMKGESMGVGVSAIWCYHVVEIIPGGKECQE